MKKTLRSLWLSGISILLCFAMLAGSTFAWFTDSVESGGNQIIAGNLDIEMWWSKDLTSGNWINAEDENSERVFDYDKWEPGYTEVRYVKIVNSGSLAFKYALSIIADGELGILADVIDVYFVEAPEKSISDREELKSMTPVGTLTAAIKGQIPANGVLLPAGEVSNKYYSGEIIVAIALKMREDAGNEYMGKSVGDSFSLKLEATQFDYEKDSFGDDYDQGLEFPKMENFDVVVDLPIENGVVTTATTVEGEGFSVTVPAGVKTVGNSIGASVTEKATSDANLTLSENEIMRPIDVHVEGLAEGNTVPVIIDLGVVMPASLNIGNYTLYHVENGASNAMTAVNSVAELDTHNEFYYDPTTGNVTVAMASFSEVAMVADSVNAWEGNFDYSWYDASKTELQIANADQLAAFGAIVGGMKKVTGRVDGKYTYSDEVIQDSFAGKTVKLIADINLGDKESENNPNIIFHPIGYWNNEGTYERKPTNERTEAVSSGFYAFEGTFDGNGNTISNFYQNTWEIKGDHNWYSAVTEQYFRDGMGLFGKVYGGTVKSLTIDNFSSDGEITTTGVIAAYADSKKDQPAIFENIAITNCNPRVYNIGNGGIVGCAGWYSKDVNLSDADYNNAVVFRNITVDQTNKISALWGTYDVSCGGILGQYYPDSKCGIKLENCHVSAIIDVNNDVCANYQYYWYRYSGMFIGTIRANTKDESGYTVADTTGIIATNCTYSYGSWNEYWYCELVKNSSASYTHDYQFGRLTNIDDISEIKSGEAWTKEGNFALVSDDRKSVECYHIFKDSNGNLYRHFHDVADESNPNIYEDFDLNGDGELNDLKEDRQCYYLPFGQVFNGLGYGVKPTYTYDGFKLVEDGTVISGTKFEVKDDADLTYRPGETVYLKDLVNLVVDASKLSQSSLYVSASPVDEDGTVSIKYNRDVENWMNNNFVISGDTTGAIKIVITDYFYCTPTVIILGAHECVYETIEENRVEATCTTAGSYDKVIRCKECNKELSRETITIDAPGHSAGPGATCTTAQTCTICGTELAPALNHNYTAVKTNPTCTEEGYTTYTCWCGHSYVANEVAALGHSHSAVVTAPTCTTEGYTIYTCWCGDTYKADQTSALGHTANTAVEENRKNATCEESGSYDSVVYCKVCSAEMSRETIEIPALGHSFKFESKFNGDFLYRVGNQNEFSIDSLFTVYNYNNISVDITAKTNGVSGKYDENSHKFQFTGTGVVTITVTDKNCKKSTSLNLEVVDATNVTELSGTLSGNVVLLNDCGLSSLTVSGRNAVYGNGFTATYSGNGQYLNNGLKQGVINVSENGTLDNLRIVAPIYPKAYMYYGKTTLGDYVQGGPSSTETQSDGTVKTRYHYQLSAVAASGNATISNCYIYGGRNNIFVNTGDVTIKDTVLECGTVANVQIQSNSSHTITLENVTTIQYQVNPTIDDTSKVMLGAGVLVGPETNNNPTLVLNGELKQYNWVNEDDYNDVSDDITKRIIDAALNATDYNHTVSGKTASNLGVIYMNAYEAVIKNNTALPYKLDTLSISGVDGQAYSLQGATESQIYSDYEKADRFTENDWYQPQYNYPSNLGGQYIENTDDCDEFLYREGDSIHVMFVSGGSKTINLATLVNITKYSGQDLKLAIACKDGNGNAVTITDGKITLSKAGIYTVTYTVTDTLFYDKDGKTVTQTLTYSWNVEISVSLKDKSIPNAYFTFDSSKQIMGYGTKSILEGGLGKNNFQYIPFLAGLQIYDYNGQETYLRFDGNTDFHKIANVSLKCENKVAYITVGLTDGGIINVEFGGRAHSGSSTYTGTIQTNGNTIYYLTDGDTATTTTYWEISSYSFVGFNGVEIVDKTQKFSNCVNGDLPLDSFGTSTKYTVTYNANGGNCVQSVGYATSASATVSLPLATRSGYVFKGWYTAASGGTRVGGLGDSYTPSANITLYAQWGEPFDVTFDYGTGTVETQTYRGTPLTLPNATNGDKVLKGWYDAASGGNRIGGAGDKYTPTVATTLYAQWQTIATVTYDATTNGGSCSTTSAIFNGADLVLPTPNSRTGHTFNGWYTAASGGTKIGDAGAKYIPEKDITLYAQWKVNSYNINVTISSATVTINGTKYTGNKTLAFEYGATVEVTLNSFSQSKNKKFSITGITDSVSDTTTGKTYTFTMPANEVTINASSSCVTGDTLVTLADGTQKRIDEVTYNDQLLVWNFYTGKYDVVSSALIQNHGYAWNNIIKLTFSDGTVTKAVNEHWYFDATLNEYVMITPDTASEYIGHEFVKQNGESYKTVTLTSVEISEEYIEAYSILSAYNYNFITDGIFSLTSPVIETNFFMPFEVGEDMTFDEEKMANDIEKYGLYEYADFENQIPYEVFEALNIKYLKVAVGKGLITKDQIIELLVSEGVID